MSGALPADQRQRVAAIRRPDQAVVLGTWAPVFDSTEAELDATVEALASGVDAPYLALHGIDPGPDYAVWLQRMLHQATVEVWPDVGHYPHLVDPARFVSRLAAFEQQLQA
jgi:pimeloyl-ACP methyl ester carboxylesterase